MAHKKRTATIINSVIGAVAMVSLAVISRTVTINQYLYNGSE